MSLGNPAIEPAPLSVAMVPEHELLRPIASGAYGQVWLACNRLGAYRAVKIVHRVNFDHERPFEREFTGIKAFEPISRTHDGFVDLLQVGRDDSAGYFYYVMELADNLHSPNTTLRDNGTAPSSLDSYTPRTLASELKSRGRLPVDDCIEIGLALVRALAHLHRQGLVHRDVKPSNIIFVQGLPKLADVGLVSGAGEARSFVGTEGFIPPEGPGTTQADIYSLGIVLYMLSTGKSHQEFPEPPLDLASWPDHARWLEFNTILHKACQAQVRERYETAEEMQEELALLQRGQSVRVKRLVQRRWAVTKKLGLAAIPTALLIASLTSLMGLKPAHTPNAEASRLYDNGRWYYNKLTPPDHAKALDFLTQAIRADPKFVQPYGELTGLYIWAMLPGLSGDQERREKLNEIADKLMAINPNLAERHAALSLSRLLERDWRGAEAEIVRAIQLNPNLAIPHQFYSYYLTMLGRTAEARRESQRAVELSPPEAARVSAIVAAWPFMAERRFDLAIAQLQQAMKLDRNFFQGHSFLGTCYEAQSNYLAAIEEWRTADLEAGMDPPEQLNAGYDALRKAFITQGEQGYWRKWIELVLADPAHPQEKNVFAGCELAGSYARIGENAKALKIIEDRFDEPGKWCRLKFEPLYDTLRDEPRFKALVRRAGLER